MAIKSIRMASASSGNYVQVIDASEVDSSANATVMERVVSGSVKLPSTMGTATRGSSANVGSADGVDLTNLAEDLTGNLIEVGDGCLLVVVCEMVANGTATVTPIAFDGQATPVVLAPLESKVFSLPYAFRRGNGSGDYVAPIQVWDVRGAVNIGLHVSALSAANQVQLWGYII